MNPCQYIANSKYLFFNIFAYVTDATHVRNILRGFTKRYRQLALDKKEEAFTLLAKN